MVLVDTSIWIDHFRRTSTGLVALLENGRVRAHPFVIGELACGSLTRRSEVLALLDLLPKATVASDDEVRLLLESQRLWARGLGWVDVHLLASTRLDKTALWTRDRSLMTAATELEVLYSHA